MVQWGRLPKPWTKARELDDIYTMLKLSILKPLHAKWILELYDYLTSEKGSGVIANG